MSERPEAEGAGDLHLLSHRHSQLGFWANRWDLPDQWRESILKACFAGIDI